MDIPINSAGREARHTEQHLDAIRFLVQAANNEAAPKESNEVLLSAAHELARRLEMRIDATEAVGRES